MAIVVRIDVELARRKMSVAEFAQRVGITPANVAVLKNGRAKAVRLSTLEAMCQVLHCQPGDLLDALARALPESVVARWDAPDLPSVSPQTDRACLVA